MQKYIGNIIVNSPNTKIENYFNKCTSCAKIINGIPTLIIGMQNAKKNIETFNILTKQYNNNMLWWTFSKTERMVDYIKDIEEFKSFCIKCITEKIEYKNINIINLDTYSKIKRTLGFIKNQHEKYYYIDNNKFIFFYDKEKSNNSLYIYGLSLNTIAFFGISKEKIINLIKMNHSNIAINNFYAIPKTIKKIINDDYTKAISLIDYFR